MLLEIGEECGASLFQNRSNGTNGIKCLDKIGLTLNYNLI